MLTPIFIDAANAVSAVGLLCSVTAVMHLLTMLTTTGRCWIDAVILVATLMALLCDHLDGAVARWQRHGACVKVSCVRQYTREYGAHLDCYVDLLTKGCIPMLLVAGSPVSVPLKWMLVGTNFTALVARYSYEFAVAPGRGLSPDYNLLLLLLGLQWTPWAVCALPVLNLCNTHTAGWHLIRRWGLWYKGLLVAAVGLSWHFGASTALVSLSSLE